MNSGTFGKPLIRAIASRSVPTTSVFAGLLKPMWLSLIWTKFMSAVAIWDEFSAACANVAELRIPPLIVQTIPVPAHAMHFRKPRRSIPSSSINFDKADSFRCDLVAFTHVDTPGRLEKFPPMREGPLCAEPKRLASYPRLDH